MQYLSLYQWLSPFYDSLPFLYYCTCFKWYDYFIDSPSLFCTSADWKILCLALRSVLGNTIVYVNLRMNWTSPILMMKFFFLFRDQHWVSFYGNFLWLGLFARNFFKHGPWVSTAINNKTTFIHQNQNCHRKTKTAEYHMTTIKNQ